MPPSIGIVVIDTDVACHHSNHTPLTVLYPFLPTHFTSAPPNVTLTYEGNGSSSKGAACEADVHDICKLLLLL